MLYHSFTVNDKEYKARLNAKALIDLEKKMGTSPINVFVEMSQKEGYLPDLQQLIVILHASLQSLEHNITIEKTYDIYDAMVDEGKTLVDLINILLEVFKVSGLIPKEEKEDNAKNA